MNRKKLLFLIIFVLILIPVSLIFFRGVPGSLFQGNIQAPTPIQSEGGQIPPQPPFHIISVSPPNNTSNVFPGTITISFTSDVDITSKQSYSITLTPPQNLSDQTAYPSKIVTAKTVGSLKQNTKYTVHIVDTAGVDVYSWTFTTSSHSSPDNPNVLEEQQKDLTQRYYPLLQYLPYDTNDFTINGYDDRLTLSVTLKISDTTLAQQEIQDWIRSKNIDPSTHKLNITSQ